MSDLPLYKMFVGGEYVSPASGKTFKVENPATGEVIAHLSEGDKEEIGTFTFLGRGLYAP